MRKKFTPRDFTRTLIESNSPDGMMLTVPVVGGSSQVKRGKVEDFRISDHGDWTRIHLGALDAAYGREPFFQFLMDGLAPCYESYPERLCDFNASLWTEMVRFIRMDEALEDMASASASSKERFGSIRSRMISKIDPRHSFIEPLFRFGTDAVLLLYNCN